MDRRNFVTTLAAAGAGVGLGVFEPLRRAALAAIQSPDAFLPRLFPIAVVQAVLDRMPASGNHNGPLVSLHADAEVARFGSAFHFTADEIIALLDLYGEDVTFEEGRFDANTGVALAVGGLAHRAVAENDILSPAAPDLNWPAAPVEKAVYADAWVLRAASSGTVEPSSIEAAEMERLLASMWPRALIRLHTLIPDGDDEEKWIERLIEWRSYERRYHAALARAIADSDSEKWEQYTADLDEAFEGAVSRSTTTSKTAIGYAEGSIGADELRSVLAR